jgi:tRNA U34 5-carboxymethylaminomethyl modifying GTPase MnmE/TrmE
MTHHPDTIFALSSGRPPAAIAVIRISGPRARHVLEVLTGRVPEPRRAALARVRDPESGEILDEALALFFPGPNSETGEDTAELQLHGGRAVIAGVLDALGRLEGFRPAEAGEFTRRAFANGQLDLTEVEGLADLIHAETAAQRRQAFRHLKGFLGERAETWRGRLIEALALVEAGIDFSDEADVPGDLIRPALAIARALRDEISAALAGAARGERLRDGLVVAIAGPPNAGKSTLLNRLARREAAIVSPHAGTTRDVIEVHLDLEGYPVTLLDTAGIRDSDDPVEQEGVRRARARAAEADLVLWVVDASEVSHGSEAESSWKAGFPANGGVLPGIEAQGVAGAHGHGTRSLLSEDVGVGSRSEVRSADPRASASAFAAPLLRPQADARSEVARAERPDPVLASSADPALPNSLSFGSASSADGVRADLPSSSPAVANCLPDTQAMSVAPHPSAPAASAAGTRGAPATPGPSTSPATSGPWISPAPTGPATLPGKSAPGTSPGNSGRAISSGTSGPLTSPATVGLSTSPPTSSPATFPVTSDRATSPDNSGRATSSGFSRPLTSSATSGAATSPFTSGFLTSPVTSGSLALPPTLGPVTAPPAQLAVESAAVTAWLVRNKVDLAVQSHRAPFMSGEYEFTFSKEFSVSGTRGDGVPLLIEHLADYCQNYFGRGEPALITRARHRAILAEVEQALTRASADGLTQHEDIIAEELRLAARGLGRLTGRVDVEDVLDVIFRDFCIGK